LFRAQLHPHLQNHPFCSILLKPNMYLRYAEQIASALECCHAHAIYHGDLKAQNIGIKANDRVLVTDFGVASISTLTEKSASARKNLGSVTTRAPELFEVGTPTARSDIWSFGALSFRMLVGYYLFIESQKVPKMGGSGRKRFEKDLVERIRTTPQSWMNSEVNSKISDPTLSATITRCLQKEPGSRWSSLSEIKRALATHHSAH
jgi:serine/threonine protein kinase